MTILSKIATVLKTTEKNVPPRLVGLRIAPVCSRCGGSGHHSFNQTHGTRCYGCNGLGHVAPKAKDLPAMLEAAQTVASNGKLDTYVRSLAVQKSNKTAKDRLFAAWSNTNVAKANRSVGHMIRNEQLDGLEKIRVANKQMCDCVTEAIDALNRLDARKASFTDDSLEANRLTEAAFATICAVDFEVDSYYTDNRFQLVYNAETAQYTMVITPRV